MDTSIEEKIRLGQMFYETLSYSERSDIQKEFGKETIPDRETKFYIWLYDIRHPAESAAKKLWIRFNLLGFDKNSSATFTKHFYATGNESFQRSFNLFKEEIPFHNWYYELEIPYRDAYDDSTLDQVFGEAMLGLKP